MLLHRLVVFYLHNHIEQQLVQLMLLKAELIVSFILRYYTSYGLGTRFATKKLDKSI
ncbi:hypothetical protein Krac_11412 [Ktedonobacter racemifer DSM 44963]|uniref:Uncharacterized protein n=1 Tax=Ktedonobacter racemifer DSM 44963 TaxID=485913 RepID=D6TBQ1_KTERA|nr:hypothetical protein Krac_11412 [Ktedonobacter racemifer DSM 44963]